MVLIDEYLQLNVIVCPSVCTCKYCMLPSMVRVYNIRTYCIACVCTYVGIYGICCMFGTVCLHVDNVCLHAGPITCMYNKEFSTSECHKPGTSLLSTSCCGGG